MNLTFLTKFIPTVHLTFMAITGLSAQSAQIISLDDAIAYALNENSSIKNAQVNIADDKQQIIERRAFGIPQLNADVSFQRYLQLPPLPPSFDSFGAIFELLPDSITGGGQQMDGEASIFFRNSFTMGLSLDAMIFDGSYFTGLQAAKAYRQYVDQELLIEQREVKNKVTNAYLPILLLNENIKLLDKNISNLEKLLKNHTASFGKII